MKIVSMNKVFLKKTIKNKVKYKYIYEVFDKYYEILLETIDWMRKDAIVEYKN